MNNVSVKEKIRNLEAEIKLLKTAVAGRPDFDIDKANWQKIKPVSKKARAELFKTLYG